MATEWTLWQFVLIFCCWTVNGQYSHRHYHDDVMDLDVAEVHVEEEIRFVIDEHWIYMNGEFCAVKTKVKIPEIAHSTSKFVFPPVPRLTMEVAIFMDPVMLTQFQHKFGDDAERQMFRFASAHVHQMSALYLQQSLNPQFDIRVTHIELLKTVEPGLRGPSHSFGRTIPLLRSFCTFQARRNPPAGTPGHWDHAILLTGYDLRNRRTRAVVGVAPVGGMCTSRWYCSLVEGRGNFIGAFADAHEIGHNLGMFHDGDRNDCDADKYLMSPRLGGGRIQFSVCSNRQMNAFLMKLNTSRRHNPCLSNKPSNTNRTVTLSKLDLDTLPGQLYTADEQCQSARGDQFFQKNLPAGSLQDICQVIWCNKGTSFSRSLHPALEGTYCGDRKWCHLGKCWPWWLNTTEPEKRDGQWGEWASALTCSQCQVKDSVRLRKRWRPCNNPAPNNGGRACAGEKFGAELCFNSFSYCGDFLPTKVLFAKEHCLQESISDPELSGQTVQVDQFPCKIFCLTKTSPRKVRSKKDLPDGTPCMATDIGNRYCIQGNCVDVVRS